MNRIWAVVLIGAMLLTPVIGGAQYAYTPPQGQGQISQYQPPPQQDQRQLPAWSPTADCTERCKRDAVVEATRLGISPADYRQRCMINCVDNQ